MKKKSPKFKISLKIGDTVLEGVGATILDALRSVVQPIKITTKTIFTVTNGDITHTRVLTIANAKRLFYPAAQQYIAKNLSLFFK